MLATSSNRSKPQKRSRQSLSCLSAVGYFLSLAVEHILAAHPVHQDAFGKFIDVSCSCQIPLKLHINKSAQWRINSRRTENKVQKAMGDADDRARVPIQVGAFPFSSSVLYQAFRFLVVFCLNPFSGRIATIGFFSPLLRISDSHPNFLLSHSYLI